jgi:DNA-directed RNA polymerase specialized sigma24 family protein
MSAALQLPVLWDLSSTQRTLQQDNGQGEQRSAAQQVRKQADQPARELDASLAFYRRHTEKMLRRYLYASMQVGRSPAILGDPIGRGWVSSRPVRTFEDAVIFVLDIEACLNQLGSLDRQLLCRVVIQEYTQPEAASLLGMSCRAVAYKLPQAIDRLTEKLLDSGLMVLPN